jgi:hypothetical protein
VRQRNDLRGHNSGWSAENIIEIEKKNFLSAIERICNECRYPLLTLRIFLHMVCGIDEAGEIHISARHMAKLLKANYDTVTKCLKFLREIEVLAIKK